MAYTEARRSQSETRGLRERCLVERGQGAARVVEVASDVAAGNVLDHAGGLIRVAHDARVIRLVVVLGVPTMAEAQAVTELMHERAGLVVGRPNAIVRRPASDFRRESAEAHDEVAASAARLGS